MMYTQTYKSQYELLHILGYTKMTNSDILYSVEICTIHHKLCHILCSLEYKIFILRFCTFLVHIIGYLQNFFIIF
jgi:hypothetical protein